MSFSLSQVSRKLNNHKVNPISYFSYIKNDSRLSEGVKAALNVYVNYILKYKRNLSFSIDKFKFMVNDLLHHCCDKNYLAISIEDVTNNECDIVYEIKKAIIFGATKSLYYIGDTDILYADSCLFTDNLFHYDTSKLSKPISTKTMTKEDVTDYFKDLVVL